MKKQGITTFNDGLELKDFNWYIDGVFYKWKTDKALVFVVMFESGKTMPVGRYIEFSTNGEVWTDEEVSNAILNHELFKGSIEE